MSVLSRYYELLTFVTIANGEVKEINPDTPYTIVYYQDSRMLSQSTGLIRGIIGEPKYIVTIPLDAEDVNYSTIINTSSIVSIDPYSFDAHFDDFNNWIGVEVAEHNCIQLRVKFVNAESIVMVEQGKTYEVGFISSGNGGRNYVTATGKVKSILRNTTKEAMPSHMNHFTNDTDYIIVFDFGEQFGSSIISVNVVDIRVIRPYIDPIKYSIELLNELHTEVEAHKGYHIDKREYTYRSYSAYKEAYTKALEVLTTNGALLTDTIIHTALENFRSAHTALQDTDDEYDIVEYDKDNNMVRCNESIYPVVLIGRGDKCADLIHYTNFGSRRVTHIKDTTKLEIYWSGLEPRPNDKPAPDENIIAQVRNNLFRNNPEIDMHGKLRNKGNIFIIDCNGLECLDLGIKVIVTESMGEEAIISKYPSKLPLVSPTAIVRNSTIRDVFVSGFSSDAISRNAHLTIIDSDITDITVGSCLATTYADEQLKDIKAKIPYIGCKDAVVNLYSTRCENIWCGGIQTRTFSTCLNVVGKCNINTIYASGITDYIRDTDIRVTNLDMPDNIANIDTIVACAHDATIDKVSMRIKGKVREIIAGAYQSHILAKVIKPSNSPAISIEVACIGCIDKLYKGYSKGEELPKDWISIVCPQILQNEYTAPIIPEEPEPEPGESEDSNVGETDPGNNENTDANNNEDKEEDTVSTSGDSDGNFEGVEEELD